MAGNSKCFVYCKCTAISSNVIQIVLQTEISAILNRAKTEPLAYFPKINGVTIEEDDTVAYAHDVTLAGTARVSARINYLLLLRLFPLGGVSGPNS